MARICICWEYGTGYGHLVRYRELVARLGREGHEVVFIARAPERAAEVFAGDSPLIRAAPPGETPAARRIRLPGTFPEILLNCGFEDPAALGVRFRRWCDIVREAAPDLIVSDYSPSALMAGRVFDVPTLACGSGFYTPPPVSPLPPLRSWQPVDRNRQLNAEARVVGNINQALVAAGGAPIRDFAALYAVPQVLLTYPEFDPYPDRRGIAHLGTQADPGYGAAPRWPLGDGPAVFAYLHPGVLLQEILAALARLGARVCLFAPGLDARVLATLGPKPALELMTQPVDVTRAAAASAVMITNANLNTLVTGLKAGTPQLAVSYNLEKFLTARCLEALGAGLAAPRLAPGDLEAKLGALLCDERFRDGAARFAEKYREETSGKASEAMYDSCRHYLSRPAASSR